MHEAPRLGKTAEGDLEAGNAVTVEPGVYLPGAVGVRIEDLVIVTEGEPEILDELSQGPRHRRDPSRRPRPPLLGAFIGSATGFGFALVLSPVLFSVVEPLEAIYILLVLSLVLNALVLFEGGLPLHVNWRRLLAAVARGAPGLAAGAVPPAGARQADAPGDRGSGGDRGGAWQLHSRTRRRRRRPLLPSPALRWASPAGCSPPR